MNVWCHLPTIFKQALSLRKAGLVALCVAFITTLFFVVPSHAATGTNQTLSFSGRLSNATGGIVPDGYYNMQFKIYQDGDGLTVGTTGSPAGTAAWSEEYVNNNAYQGVHVKNGYFSVTLGSKTAFGSSIDWNQDTLYLSMNVAGTAPGCTTFGSGPCTADGEMLPMKQLTATPYAMSAANANKLGGITSDGFIQNNTTVQTGDFNISGTGIANTIQGNTSVLGPLFDRADAGILAVGTTNATAITIGQAGVTTSIVGVLGANTLDTLSATTLNIGSTNATAINLNQNVTVATNNSSVNNPGLKVQQNGSGDAAMEFTDSSGKSFYIGMDRSNGSALRISSSTSASSTTSIGTTSIGYSKANYLNDRVTAKKVTTGAQGGSLSSISIYVHDLDTNAPGVKVALYSNDAVNNRPGTLISGTSSAQTLVAGWNTIPLSATIDASTTYWIAINAEGASGFGYIYTTADSVFYDSQPFASDWSATPGAPTEARTSEDWAWYMTVAYGGVADTFSGANLLTMSDTGSLVLQNSADSANAFQVQDAAGSSVLSVNTNDKSVLVAGALDTTTAAALVIGSTNASSITIGNSSSNITTTVLGAAVFKPTTGNDSTAAFQIQRADGTAMFTADSTNQTITFGNSASGNYTVISTSTGAITKYGTARNTKKITLNAEYTGSVLDAGTGSNNSGTMTSSVDLTNRMNYYKWTTSQASNQSYDVVVQVPIPSDFDGWASSNPLSISTYTSNTTNGTITLEARDSSNAVQCNFVSVTPGSTGTWATNNSACTLSSGTYTAGDQITLRIRMQSPASGDVRIGNINLSYLSKY